MKLVWSSHWRNQWKAEHKKSQTKSNNKMVLKPLGRSGKQNDVLPGGRQLELSPSRRRQGQGWPNAPEWHRVGEPAAAAPCAAPALLKGPSNAKPTAQAVCSGLTGLFLARERSVAESVRVYSPYKNETISEGSCAGTEDFLLVLVRNLWLISAWIKPMLLWSPPS